jgi:hypothetical protein
MKLAWHYSVGGNGLAILKSGVILRATVDVIYPQQPIAWFSLHQLWERSVYPDIPYKDVDRLGVRREGVVTMGWELLRRHRIHMYRFGVGLETAPLYWPRLCKQSCISQDWARELVQRAKAWGANPRDWRGSFEPVPKSKWLAVQTYNFDAGVWRDMLTEEQPEIEIRSLCAMPATQ